MKKFRTTIHNKFLCEFIKPILFDVSLRDGIQSANPLNYPTDLKLKLLQEIQDQYNPPKMEIGSFVSPKVLPIMADTASIFHHLRSNDRNHDKESKPIAYALIPNKTGLFQAMTQGVNNFSFITSVSNAFQIKNTRKDLEYRKTELKEMLSTIDEFYPECNTKLYVSCVNECPFTGLIDKDFIIYEILTSYVNTNIDEICISDTMGTLRSADFEYIVDGLIRFGLAKNRISVHLHVDESNATDAKNILFACFCRGINQFDVSILSEGGCSVTMNRTQMKPNMTYDFFYKTLDEYIDEDVREYNGL